MSYFSRRNECVVEYSGHEDVATALRSRLLLIFEKYIGHNPVNYGSDDPFNIEKNDFIHKVAMEFPDRNWVSIIDAGAFHEVFTLVEILLEMADGIYWNRRRQVPEEITAAFKLSGSVYELSGKQIELSIDQDVAEKIESIQAILIPYSEFHERFFNAVGNLFRRKAKPEDVVKDIFVASEGYLKQITGENTFTNAINKLFKDGMIGKEQKKVLIALHEYRSDTDGSGHAGNSPTPNEENALWYLDTMIAQIRMIDKAKK